MTAVATRKIASWCRRGDHIGCSTVRAVCECSCHTRIPKTPPDPVVRSVAQKARWTRKRRSEQVAVRPWIRKEDAACCIARALPDGRLPIGYCSPQCVRRPKP